MIYVAFASIAALALVAVAALHAVGQLLRSHARERNLMLNQLLHLAGRTWEPPPAELPLAPDEDDFEERYQTMPTAMPDLYGDE